jgi:2,3-bisphosphoglycerate-independent phosphoglycerate mutase
MLILLDGLGDRALPELENRTPLQAAKTPCLDRLSAMGANGSYHATRQGEALPSENAHFAIFGYEPEYFPGRGPLEALGAGIDVGLDDVAVLSHFASFRKDGGTLILQNGQLNLGDDEIASFISNVNAYDQGDIEVHFHHTHKHYGIITLRGDVAPFFTDTDPVAHGMPLIEPVPLRGHRAHAATRNSAAALKRYLLHAYDRLQDHPGNAARARKALDRVDGLVTQRAGRLKPVPTFRQRYGLKGLSMASGLVYHGLCRLLGLDFVKVADSPHPGQDLAHRIRQAHLALDGYDLIHVHTKVPDEVGHTKNPLMKKAAIEALDIGLAKAIQPVVDDPEVLLVITSDHATPSCGPLIHSGETVPLLFCGAGIRQDAVEAYDEVCAARGALGQVRGRELILMILNAIDRIKLQGLMDTPYDQPYWPGDVEAFNLAKGE